MGGFARRGGWWVAAQAGLLVLFVVVSVVESGPAVPAGWVAAGVRALGVAMVGGSALLAVSGFRALGAGLTPYPEPIEGASLVDHGAYAWVRHPLYGAVVLGVAGAALLQSSLWPGVVAAVVLVFFYAKAVHEERRLREAYPGYAEYERRVGYRLIPGLI